MPADFDVIVIGGGAAGVAAAIAATKTGARTALIERHGFFGGLATAANVGTICGLYSSLKSTPIASVFASDFAQRVAQYSGSVPSNHGEKLFFLPYNPIAFEQVCDELLASAGVSVFLHSTVCNVTISQGRLTSLAALVWNQPEQFEARSFVDASGEGLLSRLAGCSLSHSEQYQAPGFVARIAGIERDDERYLNLVLLTQLETAERDGILESARLSVVPGSITHGTALLKFASPTCRMGTFNELSAAERFARRSIRSAIDYLRSRSEEFAQVKILQFSPQLGVRSGPRGAGMYQLTKDDVLSARKFEDGIANAAWPLEYWGASRKAELEFIPPGEHYQIPARCLRSAELENTFLAGRGIAAEESALSSARVIGTSLATGFAAGSLAAGQAFDRPLVEVIAQIRSEQLGNV